MLSTSTGSARRRAEGTDGMYRTDPVPTSSDTVKGTIGARPWAVRVATAVAPSSVASDMDSPLPEVRRWRTTLGEGEVQAGNWIPSYLND